MMARSEKRRRGWRQRLMGWALLIVVGYVLYAGALFVMQGRLMWPRHLVASAAELGEPGVEAHGVERFWVDIGGGERVEAWYARGRVLDGDTGQKRPLVVMAHGNAELIDDHVNRMLNYRDLGVSSLVVEYRGYGRSDGTPGQRGIVDDFARALEMTLAREEVDAGRVVYHGRSIGAGVLCALAERRKPAGMILESAFTSAAGMAGRFGIPGFLVRSPFRNDRVVKDFDGPILLFHGTRDEIIPVAHSRELHAMAKRGTLIEQDAMHNDFPVDAHAMWYEVEKWLLENGL